jgi:hypothetical protein
VADRIAVPKRCQHLVNTRPRAAARWSPFSLPPICVHLCGSVAGVHLCRWVARLSDRPR